MDCILFIQIDIKSILKKYQNGRFDEWLEESFVAMSQFLQSVSPNRKVSSTMSIRKKIGGLGANMVIISTFADI